MPPTGRTPYRGADNDAAIAAFLDSHRTLVELLKRRGLIGLIAGTMLAGAAWAVAREWSGERPPQTVTTPHNWRP